MKLYCTAPDMRHITDMESPVASLQEMHDQPVLHRCWHQLWLTCDCNQYRLGLIDELMQALRTRLLLSLNSIPGIDDIFSNKVTAGATGGKIGVKLIYRADMRLSDHWHVDKLQPAATAFLSNIQLLYK